MTPLLWAFPDRKLERFECLLSHGANPNVIFETDFGVGRRPFNPMGGSFYPDRGCHAGQSVMQLACRSPMIEHLRLVVAHGGDVNLVDKKTGQAPLHIVLDRHFTDTKDRVELLIAHKANLNRYCEYQGTYPAMEAVQSDEYDVALLLLESGRTPIFISLTGKENSFISCSTKKSWFFNTSRDNALQTSMRW